MRLLGNRLSPCLLLVARANEGPACAHESHTDFPLLPPGSGISQYGEWLAPQASMRFMEHLGSSVRAAWTAVPRRLGRYSDGLQLVALLLPFAFYVACTLRFALNVPVFDDYGLVLDFLDRFLEAASLRQAIGLMFLPWNGHRLVLEKLIVLAQYCLLHAVNFRVLIVVGVLPYLLFVCALLAYLWSTGFTLLETLPIPYVLFSFTHYDIMSQFSGSNGYFGALFSLLFILCILRRHLALSAGMFLLGIFSYAGCLVLLPIGIVYLLIKHAWRKSLGLLVAGGILLSVFFYHYGAAPSTGLHAALSVDFGDMALFLLAFLGSFMGNFLPAVAAGAVVLASLVFIVCTGYRAEDLAFLVAFYIIASAAEIAVTRSYLGPAYALQPRYTVYSLLGSTCVYIWAQRTLALKVGTFKYLPVAALAVSIFFFSGVLKDLQRRDLWTRWNDMAVSRLVAGLKNPTNFNGVSLREAHQLRTYDYVHNALPLVKPALLLELAADSQRRLSGLCRRAAR